jgi:predicted transcriptional regulator
MSRLTDRMALAKIVLHELKRQTLSRTDLEKKTIAKAGTPATFESIFRFLSQGGYVQKSSKDYRAKYVLTDKGAKFLEAL